MAPTPRSCLSRAGNGLIRRNKITCQTISGLLVADPVFASQRFQCLAGRFDPPGHGVGKTLLVGRLGKRTREWGSEGAKNTPQRQHPQMRGWNKGVTGYMKAPYTGTANSLCFTAWRLTSEWFSLPGALLLATLKEAFGQHGLH